MKNIALALSGGGFRAAAFSLGTMSYLNELKVVGQPLLHQVRFIGSSSGGSITNSIYSSMSCEGKNFETIYHFIIRALSGDQLIKRVFDILQDDQQWKLRPKKSRNLVNAFAMAYDDPSFLNGASFGLLSEKLHETHLQEITINATEFTNGMSFRFQSQGSSAPRGKVGNHYIYFLKDSKPVFNKLKLSDILACSSCFPGGLEPVIFPDDFTHGELGIEELVSSISFKTNDFTIKKEPELLESPEFLAQKDRFGLMDGGIADNQAIDSIIVANERRKKKKLQTFDLIIATDVSSYFMDGYTLPMEKRSWLGRMSIGNLIGVFQSIGFLAIVLLIISLCCKWSAWFNLLVLPTVSCLLAWLWTNHKIEKMKESALRKKSTWGVLLSKYIGKFLDLRYSSIRQMFSSRIKSVGILSSDIYLKQIRRHYYRMLYADPELSNIVVSNAIYDLSEAKLKTDKDPLMRKELDPLNEPEHAQDTIKIDKDLKAVAERARTMPTTLWFDEFQSKDDYRAAIIATGQFTICYNLIRHLEKREQQMARKKQQPILSSEEQLLRQQLLDHWEQFNQDPYFLYKKLQILNRNQA